MSKAVLQQVGTKQECDGDILSCLNKKCNCKHNKIMEQKTLEEGIGLKAHEYSMQYVGTDKYTVSMLAIEFGYHLALEQQERSYSEEDMQQAIQFGKDIRSEKSFINYNFGSPYIDYEDSTLETAELFEQFKKK